MTPSLGERLARDCLDLSGPPILEVESLSGSDCEEIESRLCHRQWILHIFDAPAFRDGDDLLGSMARELQFPRHLNRDWEAFVTGGSDLSWLPAAGNLCMLLGTRTLSEKHPALYQKLREAVRDIHQRMRLRTPPRAFKMLLCAEVL